MHSYVLLQKNDLFVNSVPKDLLIDGIHKKSIYREKVWKNIA